MVYLYLKMMYTFSLCYGETANSKWYVLDTIIGQNLHLSPLFYCQRAWYTLGLLFKMVLLISKPRIRQNFPISHRQCLTRVWGEEPASGGADKLVFRWVAHSQEDR